ncbi:hypothetical protein, partial [Streptococcus pneumoniae]|uniref:hypothetical protein n=1 Tax=Streptococcus pneumoniae TaxID=1313 RepID=UPI0034DD12AE
MIDANHAARGLIAAAELDLFRVVEIVDEVINGASAANFADKLGYGCAAVLVSVVSCSGCWRLLRCLPISTQSPG